nr:MAG TPA: hypothetical protein [Bacteriophage sp.]
MPRAEKQRRRAQIMSGLRCLLEEPRRHQPVPPHPLCLHQHP